VALPAQLFYTTQIPASLWFVSRDRYDHKFRDRHDEILFIDARKMDAMVTRKNRDLKPRARGITCYLTMEIMQNLSKFFIIKYN